MMPQSIAGAQPKGAAPQRWPRVVALWLSGCLLFSIGVKMFLDSRLGADPLHAMIVGIVRVVDTPGVRIGVVEAGVVLVSLVLWSTWNRRIAPGVSLSVLLTMTLVGFGIDACNWLSAPPPPGPLGPGQVLLGASGIVLDAYASALIIASGFGIRNMDLIALTAVDKLGWPFAVAKSLIEAGFVLAALLCCGPVGIVTFVFILVVGPLIQLFCIANCRLFGWPDAVRG